MRNARRNIDTQSDSPHIWQILDSAQKAGGTCCNINVENKELWQVFAVRLGDNEPKFSQTIAASDWAHRSIFRAA
eukprot:scaffold4991_cov417-Prasinococcus_capsulatus_cf.AAC.6